MPSSMQFFFSENREIKNLISCQGLCSEEQTFLLLATLFQTKNELAHRKLFLTEQGKC